MEYPENSLTIFGGERGVKFLGLVHTGPIWGLVHTGPIWKWLCFWHLTTWEAGKGSLHIYSEHLNLC